MCSHGYTFVFSEETRINGDNISYYISFFSQLANVGLKQSSFRTKHTVKLPLKQSFICLKLSGQLLFFGELYHESSL